jgi:hypothetical protein
MCSLWLSAIVLWVTEQPTRGLPGRAKEDEEMALSRKRIMLLVTVALVMAAMMLVAMAMPASATHVERANEKACQGLVISLLATSNNPEGPFPPPKAAEALSTEEEVVDVKTYTERVREGRYFVESPTGEVVARCDPEEE